MQKKKRKKVLVLHTITDITILRSQRIEIFCIFSTSNKSLCMLMNHGPSQHSFEEEYKQQSDHVSRSSGLAKTILQGTAKGGEKTGQTEEEVGRQHQGMDWPRVRQVPKGSREQGKMEETGCKNICGAPMTLAAKGLMMMMMMNRTTRRLPGHRKETQTAVVWKCLLFIRFCPKPFCKAR